MITNAYLPILGLNPLDDEILCSYCAGKLVYQKFPCKITKKKIFSREPINGQGKQ